MELVLLGADAPFRRARGPRPVRPVTPVRSARVSSHTFDARRTPPEVLPPSFASPRRLKTVLLGRRRRLMPRRSAPRAFAGAASPDPTPVSPGTALVRERHDREIDDAFNKALLARSESYGSLARRLPNAVPSDRPARRSTPNAPSLPDLEPLDTNPTQLPGAAANANADADANADANADDAAAYARGRAAAAAVADAADAVAARERRVEAFASALAAHLRDPSDDHFAALGLEDPTAAMVRDFREALEMGDADFDAANPAAGAAFEPLSPTERNLPAFVVAREPEPAVDEDGVEFEAIDQGETPFFLESPKMAAFDNFVDDEGASRDVSAATTEYEDDFDEDRENENGEGEGGERKSENGEGEGDENAEDEREAEERRPILDGAAWRAYGSAAGAAGTRPRMDGRIATPRKWDEDDDKDDEETGVDDAEVDEDESDSDGSSSDDSDSEEEPGGRKSSGMLRRAKGRYVPSPTSSPARASKPMAAAAAAAAAAAGSARTVHSASASAFGFGSSSFKIKCGRCAAMLKLPAGVPLFRCPKCAAKLRVPAELLESEASTARSNSKSAKNAGSNPSAASASRTLWELREREAAIEAELAAIASSRRAAANRRAATEELERHMAFSRSLEVVVEELSRRVARR